jgi:glycosyltransferase involved in cell wall biosynthesis
LITTYAASISDVEIVVVNTAVRWRSTSNLGILSRLAGGGAQFVRDMTRLIHVLANNQLNALHLTTSGHLGTARDFVIALVSKLFKIGFIYHVRFGRIPNIAQSNSIEWRLIHRVMRHATCVIVLDQGTLKAVRRFAPTVNVMLVPNCVNTCELPEPCAPSSGIKTAMYLGWVVPSKGIHELLEAWTRINPENWTLEIVGPVDPQYKESLLKKFEPQRVKFVGEISHAQAMLRMSQCDLFILPSHSEGFPNAVVEAMALGRAILATEVGAIPEMLEGDAGLLVQSKDPDALAAALSEATSNAMLRAQLGRRAFDKARRCYTIDVVFAAYRNIWRDASSHKHL